MGALLDIPQKKLERMAIKIAECEDVHHINGWIDMTGCYIKGSTDKVDVVARVLGMDINAIMDDEGDGVSMRRSS